MESVVVNPTLERESILSPGYMQSIPEEDPRYLAQSTTELGREQETQDISAISRRLADEVASLQPSYEDAKRRYEEAKQADFKFRTGSPDGASIENLRLREELVQRQAEFEALEKEYLPKVKLRDNLRAALNLAPTVAEARSILQQRLEENEQRRQRNKMDRSAVRAAEAVREQQKQLDQAAGESIQTDPGLAGLGRNLRQESTSILDDTLEASAMLGALDQVGASDIVSPVSESEIESTTPKMTRSEIMRRDSEIMFGGMTDEEKMDAVRRNERRRAGLDTPVTSDNDVLMNNMLPKSDGSAELSDRKDPFSPIASAELEDTGQRR
tara:strand:+ start:1884 stop:2864 length:981 start_codon:yes stop_codon:yes gene_type:complete